MKWMIRRCSVGLHRYEFRTEWQEHGSVSVELNYLSLP